LDRPGLEVQTVLLAQKVQLDLQVLLASKDLLAHLASKVHLVHKDRRDCRGKLGQQAAQADPKVILGHKAILGHKGHRVQPAHKALLVQPALKALLVQPDHRVSKAILVPLVHKVQLVQVVVVEVQSKLFTMAELQQHH
jgi:hypothetical protein